MHGKFHPRAVELTLMQKFGAGCGHDHHGRRGPCRPERSRRSWARRGSRGSGSTGLGISCLRSGGLGLIPRLRAPGGRRGACHNRNRSLAAAAPTCPSRFSRMNRNRKLALHFLRSPHASIPNLESRLPLSPGAAEHGVKQQHRLPQRTHRTAPQSPSGWIRRLAQTRRKMDSPGWYLARRENTGRVLAPERPASSKQE